MARFCSQCGLPQAEGIRECPRRAGYAAGRGWLGRLLGWLIERLFRIGVLRTRRTEGREAKRLLDRRRHNIPVLDGAPEDIWDSIRAKFDSESSAFHTKFSLLDDLPEEFLKSSKHVFYDSKTKITYTDSRTGETQEFDSLDEVPAHVRELIERVRKKARNDDEPDIVDVVIEEPTKIDVDIDEPKS